MLTVNQYSALVNGWINALKLPTNPVGLYEPITYMLAGGGKRLRPTLLCAAADAFGLSPEKVKHQALGIELFHNFTLLHDDVMDNADVRHGVPTVHIKWDERTAILSGDTMLTLAVQNMSNTDNPAIGPIMRLFNKTAIEVYEGQQMDMNFESLDTIEEQSYIEMIRLKTSVLLACATSTGALLAGVDEYTSHVLYSYAENMGIAFQLRDDYLDTFGNQATFGKAIGGDILNNKKTWLWVNANSNDSIGLKKVYSIKDSSEKIDAVTQLFVKLGCDARCLDAIEFYTNKAIAQLENCKMSVDAFKFFKDFALMAVNRDH